MATLADFRALLPQFAAVADATVQAWLDQAARWADTDYGADQNNAQIYLAAHLMSMAGVGPEKGAVALVGVKAIRSGALSIEKDAGTMGDYGLTTFGRMFWPMFRAAKGGPRVLPSGDYPYPYGPSICGSDGYVG